MKPNFSLILLAYNDEKTVENALDSIKNQDIYKQNIPFELIIIPNGCTDSTEQKIDNYVAQNKKLFTNVSINKLSIKNGHRNKALNIGIQKSHGEIVMYMNSDCTITSNTLSLLHGHLTKNKNLYVVGPNDLPVLDEINKHSILYKMFEGEEILWKIKGKYLPIGRFMAFRRSLIEKFPVDIHSEDIWLGLISIQKHGLESVKVEIDASVYWTPPNEWSSYISLYTRYVHGITQLLEVHPEIAETYMDVVSKTNPFSKGELIKKVIAELITRGLDEKEAVEYIQTYKAVRDVINENEKLMASRIIKNNGTWITDR